jgi:DtxR family transcriptional regulator, Mn-dependent transcriptional regulator
MSDVWKEFNENIVTHSAAHHLLAIRDLMQKRGYARVSDVAKNLNITTGSASTNLKSLRQKGLVVEDDNKFLSLSPEGMSIAEAIVARRTILQNFLTVVLEINAKQAEIDACKTEHLFSSETTNKMEEYLKKLR